MFHWVGCANLRKVARRYALKTSLLVLVTVIGSAVAHAATDQPKSGGPTDPKALKTYNEAADWEHHGNSAVAIDCYRKANKQDGGHCTECLNRAYNIAMKIGAYKDAANIERDELPMAQTDQDRAEIHFQLGVALQRQAESDKKEGDFSASCDEFKAALALDPSLATTHFALGTSLAYLHQDEAARDEFHAFLEQAAGNSALRERAARYVERPELARARMVPPFSLTTIDGRHISMDGLVGKVVLIDFWATWCGPCREALPHVRKIAQEFQGQPFVVLSVSLDSDDTKWRDFIKQNEMTWLQYRDGRWTGPIATEFDVKAIPTTFSVDADGVLEDQHVGEADIEGKLKKMIAHAAEKQNRMPAAAASR